MRRAHLRVVDASADTLFVNPRANVPWELGSFRMLAECRCAEGSSSGDFFAFRMRGPKRLAVVIGDACGRGVEGAKLLPGVLSSLQELAPSYTRPSQLLHGLNQRLAGELSADRFVTCAAFEIDADKGTFTMANAGHVPAVVRRSAGSVNVVGRASGPPLGILGSSRYFDERCKLGRGDVIVLMTDGVLEAIETELAEMSTLRTLMAETRGGSGAIHQSLLDRLANGRANAPGDDMTLLSLELLTDPRQSRHPLLERAI